MFIYVLQEKIILKFGIDCILLKAIPAITGHGGSMANYPCSFCSVHAPKQRNQDGTMKLGITWTKYLGLDGNDAKLYERSETSGVLAHLMAKMDANLILEVAVMPALHLLLSVNGLIKISLNASI